MEPNKFKTSNDMKWLRFSKQLPQDKDVIDIESNGLVFYNYKVIASQKGNSVWTCKCYTKELWIIDTIQYKKMTWRPSK
jgi:hypothetical protein